MSVSVGSVASNKSTFVTVTAWIFIVLSGFSTLISIMQNIMVQTMFSSAEMANATAAANQSQDVPFFAEFMLNNFKWFFAAVLVLSATTFVSSIGLLKRKDWARKLFIGLMGAGIAWNVFAFAMQLVMFSSMQDLPAGAPDEFQSQFRVMSIVMTVFGAAMVIGFSLLFGWIIKKLLSPSIAMEFHSGP